MRTYLTAAGLCLLVLMSASLSGCTTVKFSSAEDTSIAKKFNNPSEKNSGIYIYRDGFIGGMHLQKAWINDDCIGAIARDSFIYKEILGGNIYKVSTSSAIGKNSIQLKTEPGKNYFIRQYLIIGPISGMTYLEEKEESEAIESIKKLNLLPNKCDY